MNQDEANTVAADLAALSFNPDSPPPVMSSEGIIAVDVTAAFASAAASLRPGELVKDRSFTLFDAVGAIEIMDPKMDSGCLESGESQDEEYDVARPLLPAEVLGIIDQLLSLEMAWHLGYPLSQTLLTNVYIEAMLNPEPKRIEDADFVRKHKQAKPDDMHVVLRAFCLGQLKSCWHVNERIKKQHYYEEEDFVTTTYHRYLLERIDQEAILKEMDTARKRIHHLADLSAELAGALGARLEIRTAFLRAMELSELRSDPDSLKLPWKQMRALWEDIDKSHELARPVPEAFSTKIQRRLASTMPPRPIVQLSFDETAAHFRRLCDDAVEVLDVLKYANSQSLLNFVMAFQAQKPQPLVFIRTLLQYLLFQEDMVVGQRTTREVIDDDLAIVVLPCSPLLDQGNDAEGSAVDPKSEMARPMDEFRHRASQSYLGIFRAFCHNRCRVRRILCHNIQDWETVQMDAESIDMRLHPLVHGHAGTDGESADDPASYALPLSSWCYLYKLRIMEWIVQLGFELSTYQTDELAGMYWYLAYLSKMRSAHLERIGSFTLRRLAHQRAAHRFSLPSATEKLFARSLDYLRISGIGAAVTYELADALSCLYAALARLKLVCPPGPRPSPYGSAALRYEVRMKPFAPIGLPELPSFDEFADAATQPDMPIDELLACAHGSVQNARKAMEPLSRMTEEESFTEHLHGRWMKDVHDLKRAAVMIGIAVATVRRVGDPAGELLIDIPGPPGPDDKHHAWWVVPVVREKRVRR